MLEITFPESLPVSARRDEIATAIRDHQVVIVCGETGSGKTTQLPKIALALGRGKCNAPPGKGRLIGHTQPRRIAATSVAKRIAEELKTPLGDVVGYKVRFQDRLSRDASVKLMTDGILLAETQGDPDLKAYDTLIIDEAHERSLNIDFLLGYLKQLLPRRPDLKIIVTSATIDADRFARHFGSHSPAPGRPKPGTAPLGGSEDAQREAWGSFRPAPVIMVSGRMFPVEQRYRPFEESREYDLNNAIADATDELWMGGGGGDILVFLPGEREIREAADHLRKHLAHQPLHRNADVIPLFARLSQQEQDRVFEVGNGKRIVLSTNVAETSLTVPGIRYVIDAGTARVKRYSFRNKVEQLLVEPIAQAAANQRSGRCGRVADGVCIRLYEQKDFDARSKFTDPEILRSSLAGVILRMKALRLGHVENFPFIEPPQRRAIADGYDLLQELGAVDEYNELTDLGAELSRLPLDPRVGRMIIEARSRNALDEVLIIASALSVQDVRDRPMEAQQQADEAHKKFDDEKSEFTGYLKLWKWINEARGGQHDKAAPGGVRQDTHKLSNRQHEQLLRQNFVNIRRVREWRDIYSQLHTVVTEHKWRLNSQPASYEQLHLSMLAGLLGNIGWKLEDEEVYLGARGIKFYRHPGANLSKKPGRWIVAAELVDTSRLFGRGIAAIEPQWIEQVAGHLLKKQLLDPHWERKSAEVIALERATLYGIVIYSGRRVNYSKVDPVAAREVFIREALVGNEWETKLPFLAQNEKLLKQVEDIEHKSRRQDVLVDDELIFAYYDQQIPAEVCSGTQLEHWYREESKKNPKLLMLTREELMRHEAAGITTQAFPKVVRLGGVDCRATYLHEPGDAKDGLTVEVPLFALNQVNEERCEWLVPGMLQGKIFALIKSLHQRPRSRLVPLPDSAARFYAVLSEPTAFGSSGLVDALLKLCRDATAVDIKRGDFKLDMLAPHLFMNFRVVDEHGRQMGAGRNLAALKAELGAQARGAFASLAALSSAASKVPKPASDDENAKPNQALGQQNSAQPATKNVAQNHSQASTPTLQADARYTAWTFGELPELLEIQRQSGRGSNAQVQTLIGFPALVDQMDAVSIEVFDEPDVAAAKHRAGLRRLCALQIKDALKYLEKNIPDLQKMSVAYMQLGTADELKSQIIDVALDKAFLLDPLPTNADDFKRRLEEGRGRLTLIANEVARLCGTILTEYATAARKIKDTKTAPDATADATQQLARLMPKRFLTATTFTQLQHFPRYLKAITLRLEKHRADPARDAQRLSELRPQEQRFIRLLAERKGVLDVRLAELRWLLEELRVSFFAQELRTPQPVSTKRLDKVWAQLAL
jgi:ATP-dependent helicase HrpA